ncbi:hypothetical protein NVS55_09815 [Myxococcus stipitatus]|uniref:hypothetical protein n=1 Tax=Myxococcus stipitatus TaxID=83455 RepID=UPI0031453630
MRAERLWRGGPGLLLMAVLLVSGCASLPARSGQERVGPTLAFTPFSVSAQAAPEVAVSVDASGADVPMSARFGLTGWGFDDGASGSDAQLGGDFFCGREALPSGWPRLDSSREVVEPFLACASPAAFVAMQRRVDMAAFVASLEDWDAVRLGALGPMDARASAVLGRKRAAFLVTSVEKYGVPYAEVLGLFVLHTAFDDELREVVQRLARDKQLEETLGSMPVVREELRRRGLALEEFAERGEQAGDVLRGLGRVGRDLLSSSPASVEARYSDLMVAKRGQLPPPYQDALDEVRRALTERHYAPGSIAAGAFDHLTFGVPLGFYALAAGVGQGAESLARGKYEQASRELAPAALVVALYASGKGARAFESRGPMRLQMPALDADALKLLVARLENELGISNARVALRHIQATREGAMVGARWGEAGVKALYEAHGDPAKAQATLAVASRESAGGAPTRGGGSASETSTPRGTAGTPVARRRGGTGRFSQSAEISAVEAAKAKLLQAEREASGSRLPKDVKLLKKVAPKLDEPPPGVEQGAPLWRDYVAYRKRRLKEIRAGEAVKGPLVWEGYQGMRAYYARGMAFERAMVAILEADAALPRAMRKWLGDFEQPRIETHVGVAKADFRYADVLVIEERPVPGQPPRVETFSFKSRNLSPLKREELTVQVNTDASNAMKYYGGSLRILREGMRQPADVQRVRVVYEGQELLPKDRKILNGAARAAEKKIKGVEVVFR